MAKLIAVQMEPCHKYEANAFYAYFDAKESSKSRVKKEIDQMISNDAAWRSSQALIAKREPLYEPNLMHDKWEEIPNSISKAAGWKRYYIGATDEPYFNEDEGR